MTTLNTAQAAKQSLFGSHTSYDTAYTTASTRTDGTSAGKTIPTSDAGQTDTQAPVQITLSQAGLDFLADTSSTSSTYLASAQEALGRLDQLAKSIHAAAKEQAAAHVNAIKAQMRQLMQLKALMSPKALAQELAQLARQLAAAVAEYTQSGGSDAAVGNALLAAPQNTTQTPTASQDATSQDTTASQTQQTTMDTPQNGTSTTDAQSTTPAGTTESKDRNNQDFLQTVQELSTQMKALLEENERRFKKQNTPTDTDLEAARDALESVDQLMPKI